MSEAKRIRINLGTFDLMKGIALMLVIFGHKMPYYHFEIESAMVRALLKPIPSIFELFRFGSMPLFFVIAGFGFKRRDTIKFLKKTFSELIKPYLYVMIACAICFPLVHYAVFRWWPGAVREAIGYVLAFLLGLPEAGKTFMGYQVHECAVVWFLLAMFIALNLLNQIARIKSEAAQGTIVIICFWLGYILSQMELNYYCFPQGLIGLGYCYAGYIVKKHELYNYKHLPWVCGVLLILSVLHRLYGDYNLCYGIFKCGFIECFLAGCTGVLLFFLSIYLRNIEWKWLTPIKKVGLYSYWILCIHAVDLICMRWQYWSSIMAEKQFLAFGIEMIISVTIIVLGCIILKKIAMHKYNARRAMHNK